MVRLIVSRLKNGNDGTGPSREGRMPSGSARFSARNKMMARPPMSQRSVFLSSSACVVETVVPGARSAARSYGMDSAMGSVLATGQHLDQFEHRHVHGDDYAADQHAEHDHQ